ncbi:MAG: gliding motility-associated ABC transporter substrate-binding protein GldG [Vicingaceae bacterium]
MVKKAAGIERKKADMTKLIAGIAILLLFNYIGSFVFFRLDLTAEKRYSLSEPTKKLVEELDDIIFFKVYLEGEFPAGFKRLRRETLEMLNEFRAYSKGGNIAYEFINPSKSSDQEERDEIYRQLFKQGLRPTDLEIQDDDGLSKKIIWPGAIVSYKDREVPLDLLKNKLGSSPEEVLNSSIENLEYALSSSILKLTKPEKPRIGFIIGHGELDTYQTADIAATLSEFYSLERVRLDQKIHSLTSREELNGRIVVKNKYAAIVIAKPDSAFSEKDKFVIDQYIMNGGSVLWLIDPIMAEMDSLTRADLTMGVAQNLNLDDQLFTYGVRLNSDLVMDVQSAMIPLPVGMLGNQPRYELFPWYYFPLLNPSPGNSITKNLNVIKGEFTSTIDFVGNDSLKKQVLLHTSPYTKLAYSPVRISLGITRLEPQKEQYNKSNLPTAVLIEGKFNSVFRGRLTERFMSGKEIQFKETGKLAKMIVIADGDIIKNHVRNDGQVLPLGVDRYTGQEYGNKDFIINAINYLCGEEELMASRSRSIKIRLLDQTKVVSERTAYQLFNMVAPVALVLLFALAFNYYRKKKYT